MGGVCALAHVYVLVQAYAWADVTYVSVHAWVRGYALAGGGCVLAHGCALVVRVYTWVRGYALAGGTCALAHGCA